MITLKRSFKKPTPERLANIALYYLSRYAASEASLRRVLENRVRRAALRDEAFAADQAAQAQAASAIESIIEKHKKLGALNDQLYAETKVHSLRRAGRSARRISQELAHKGVAKEIVEKTFLAEGEENEGAELKAAHAFARRRGLGPYRKGGASEDRGVRTKEIASLARAGFSFDTAKEVLGAELEETDAFDLS